MSFAENLKQIRKEKNISQEKLAELLDVSRQAVSKWEQGIGYPEVEKLLLLSKELNISLDSLMETEIANGENPETGNVTGSIVIESPNENIVKMCIRDRYMGIRHSAGERLLRLSARTSLPMTRLPSNRRWIAQKS